MVNIEEVSEEEDRSRKQGEEEEEEEEENDPKPSSSKELKKKPVAGEKKKDEPAEQPAAPAAPAAPEMKLSQIVPMVVMLGLQRFDIEKLGYTRHVEVGFVVVQVICLCLLVVVYDRINKMSTDGPKLKIPEVKQFGQVVTPEKTETPKEYDMGKLMEQGKQNLMGFIIAGGVYYKWAYVMPLVLQCVMTPLQLYESPLFQIHMVGKAQTRPFPTPNAFGLPSTPPAPAEVVQDSAKEAKKDQ